MRHPTSRSRTNHLEDKEHQDGVVQHLEQARAERLAAPFAARNQWRSRLLLTATTLLIAGGPLIPAALTAVGATWCYSVAA
jgi:hypothetical protein